MYNHFFGFAEHPFNVTPDPRFLFMTDSHREAYASMAYGISERKGFVCLIGEVGTGKTTLVRRLLEDLRQKKVHSVYIYQAVSTIEEMLREILQELDLDPANADKLALIRRLNDFLLKGLARHENLALLIDEAHNLRPEVMEELRLLSNLETDSAKLLQIILVGQPELGVKLNSPELRQLKQRIAISRMLKPLDSERSKQYIAHRLKMVGAKISDVFRSDAVNLICDYARGVPRVINMLCDNALLIGYGLNRKKIDVGIVKEAMRDMRLTLVKEEIHPAAPLPSGNGHGGESIMVHRRTAPRRKESPGKLSGYRIPGLLTGIVICLLLVFFLGRGYLKGTPENQGTVIAKVQPANAAIDEKKPGPPAESKAPIAPVVPAVEAKSAPPEPARPIPTPQALAFPPKDQIPIKKVVEVEEGETLSMVTQRHYHLSNPTVIDKILESNPGIINIHLVNAGQKITLPEISEESMIHAGPGGTLKIHLATFSRQIYADTFRSDPSLKGKSIELIPRKVSPQETWYRVYAGNFTNIDECKKMIAALKAKGLVP